MKNPAFSPSTRRVPLALAACVALALGLGACEQKTTTADPQKERQLQEMQAKLDALSAQSSELNRQLADRDASDAAAKRVELEREQAKLDQQRADLEAQRKVLLASESTKKPVYVRTESTSSQDDTEAVYQGKPATYEVFYSKLQDDGDWIESDEYGYIWHPAIAKRDSRWKPYADGHWVETDRGWTWESNERFGWATYHYGRWVSLEDTGWCWVPGDEWAPAWVSWRTSDRYVGWAPLPPEARVSDRDSITASVSVSFDTGPRFFNFVQAEDFGEDTYVGRIVEPEQNVTIINETVNVTNVTYVNNTVHNYGPDYEVLRTRSRRPVNQYRLDLQRNANFDGNAAAPRVEGDRLAIVAPVIERRRQSDVRPVKVERKVARVQRDNGWRGVDPAQREAVKAALQRKEDQETQTRRADRERQKQQAAWAARKANAAPAQKPAAPAQPQNPPARPPENATPANAPRRAESDATPVRSAAPLPAATPDAAAANDQKARHDAWVRRKAAEARQQQGAKKNPPELDRNQPVATPEKIPTAPVPPRPTPDGAEAVRRQNQAQMQRARAARELATQNEQAAQARAAADNSPLTPPEVPAPVAVPPVDPAQQGRANRGQGKGDSARQNPRERGNGNDQENLRRKKQRAEGEATPTPDEQNPR